MKLHKGIIGSDDVVRYDNPRTEVSADEEMPPKSKKKFKKKSKPQKKKGKVRRK